MKKIFKLVYLIVFIFMCSLPLILMPFFKNDKQIEKKELTKMPHFIENGKINLNFSSNFELWFNDSMPFRAELLSFSNLIKTEILHAPSSNVIIGKDGYLFYEVEKEDYMDTNAMTDSEINSIAITMSLIEEEIKNKGGNFTFVIMPNKSSVYDEYMPVNYKKSDMNNLVRVNEKLKQMGVNYVDMKNILVQNKSSELYHKRDSHWNYKGALIGYNALMDSLNKEHKTYTGISYRVEDWRGDLDKLLYPAWGFNDKQYVYDIDYSNFRFIYPLGYNSTKEELDNFMSDKEENDILFKTINSSIKDNKKIFVARDSFARALLPFIMDNYSETTFRRTHNPDIVSISSNTDMIFEIVERNLSSVISTAPFMYAPVRNNIDLSNLKDGGEANLYYSKESYGTRIYGDFNDTEINDRIYLQFKNKDNIITYEAFPIYEKELINSDNKSGYSLYINPNDNINDEYEITVISGGFKYKTNNLSIRRSKL